MTVYLAWIGAYSDRRVIGVYSDEATALAVAQAADEDGHVEPFDVDAGPMKPEETLVGWADFAHRLLVYVYARDEEHARKIAADKLREHFALWGTKEKP